MTIAERDGLAAGHVYRGGDADVRDALGAVGLDDLFKLGQVHVAFEGMEALGVVGLGDDDVDKSAAGELLVKPRGGEVHVAGNDVAGLDEGLGEQVLSAAALVGGDDVLVAVPVWTASSSR